MTEIAGKAALVTGGGSGIGRGLAMALAVEGAKVVVADILQERSDAVAAEIKQAGGAAIGVTCDVSDRASVRKMKADANQAFGKVLLVFANAGATSFDKMDGITDAEMDWIIQVNLMGVANCMQAFLPDMVAARDGHFMATASVAGLIPSLVGDHVPYAGAKLGVIGLILGLRRELADSGVAVGTTVLCPGGVKTRMGDSPKYRPERFGGAFEKKITPPSTHKVKLFRPPEEVAQMVLLAVRKNRPVVNTDDDYRDAFIEQYVEPILQSFDDVLDFDKIHGPSKGSATIR